MAVVYHAHHTSGQPVALKVLFPPPGAAAEIRTRFEREAETAARLHHAGIVRVLDIGQAGDYAYLAMPLVDGHSLAERLAQAGPLDEAGAIDIAWQLADALDYAHRQGVVHRDVKPSNILLTADGQALLTDFGVAQAFDAPALTRTGHTVGTPAYMAPEQASGEQPVDGRADLYALGIVLYQMVTGRTPFQGSTPQILHAHVYKPPPAPSTVAFVSPALESVILRALAKEAANRFQTGAAMAQALARLDDETGTQAVVSAAPPAASTRRRWLGWLSALIVLVLVGGLGLWQFMAQDGRFEQGSATPSSTAATLIPVAFTSPTSTSLPSPSPIPTASPVPTDTPRPPVPTDTPPPPPTSAPLPTDPPALLPSATPCPQPPTAGLTPLLADLTVSERLGCPRTEAITVNAAWQPFESGHLLWNGDLRLIYILRSNNRWSSADDIWRDGDPAFDANITPPDGYFQPVRGFGQVWRTQPGVRDDLGWATAEEDGFTAQAQPFDNGQVWHDPEQDRFFILFSDGTYQLRP
jgi:serine/threonine-protein kinase